MNKQEKVFSNSFILVVIGQIISLFGNAILRFALPLHLLTVTKSPALYGIVSAVAFVPIILCTPIGGVVADRVNKRNIMVGLDFSVAILMLLFALLNGKVNIVVLLTAVLILLYGIAGAYQPAVQASIPLLVREEGVVTANAIITMISSLSSLIGPIIGGICYSISGLKPILIISICCFFASAVMELFIQMERPKKQAHQNVLQIVCGDMKESVLYIRKKQPIVIRVVFMCALFNFLLSAFLSVALPTIITQLLGFSAATSSRLLGYNEAVMALGGLLGGICSTAISKRIEIRNLYRLLIYAAFFMLPMGFCFLFSAPSSVCFIVTAASCFALMFFATVFSILCVSYIQVNTPAEMVGKVIALCIAICQCAQPLGQSIYGLLLQYFSGSLGIIILAVGAVSIISALLFSGSLSKSWDATLDAA